MKKRAVSLDSRSNINRSRSTLHHRHHSMIENRKKKSSFAMEEKSVSPEESNNFRSVENNVNTKSEESKIDIINFEGEDTSEILKNRSRSVDGMMTELKLEDDLIAANNNDIEVSNSAVINEPETSTDLKDLSSETSNDVQENSNVVFDNDEALPVWAKENLNKEEHQEENSNQENEEVDSSSITDTTSFVTL